jgi:hypothetical protein
MLYSSPQKNKTVRCLIVNQNHFTSLVAKMTSLPEKPLVPITPKTPSNYNSINAKPVVPLVIGAHEKKPFSISREFDLVLEQHRPKNDGDVDRREWMNRLLELHPEIRSLRESVNPLTRAATFGRLYLPQNRYIPHDVLIALISQHLRTLGLRETQAALQQEWKSDCNLTSHRQYSQLSLLLQRGIFRAEKFWELSIPSIHAHQTLEQTQAALDDAISTTIGATSNIYEDKNPIENEKPYDQNFYKVADSEKTEKIEPAEASLNQIIFYVTDPNITNASDLLNALILTIQSYTSSKVFFTKIRDRIRMAMKEFEEVKKSLNNKPSLDDEDKKKISIAERSIRLSIRLLKEWMKSVINDLEPHMLESIKQFVESELMGLYSTLVANMFDKKQDPLRLQMLKNAARVDIGTCTNLWIGEFELFDLPIDELARQLTFWSYTRYYAIRRTELLDCAWVKPRLKYRAPNVIALTQHYNKLSHWVEYSIVSEQNFKKRMEKFHYFVALMQKLYSMNNFLDTAGIVGGFDSNAIFRLKFHHSQLSQQDRDFIDEMKVVFSPDKGFENLRAKQDAALLSNEPSLPYIGILLSDLFKYDDAVALFVDGLINCRKMKGLYNYISKIEEFKRSMYCFLSIDQVQEKISQLDLHDEDVLYYMSKDIEKDGATSF